MFIRKRNGNYQAVNSYRVEGKVKQHVLSLGRFSSVEEAIKQQRIMVECSLRELERPVTEYTETKLKRIFGIQGLHICRVPVKVAEKRRAKVLKRYERQKKKLEQLEGIEKVLHLRRIDTTDGGDQIYF